MYPPSLYYVLSASAAVSPCKKPPSVSPPPPPLHLAGVMDPGTENCITDTDFQRMA